MATVTSTIFSSLSASTGNSTRNASCISVSRPDHIMNLLHSCSSIREFPSIHAHLLTTNLVHDHQVTRQVVNFLVSSNDLECARQICRYTDEPESIIWNVLLENRLKEGSPEAVFVTYYDMVSRGVLLDLSTFHFLVHACCKTRSVQRGSEVHCRILKFGLGRNKSLNNNLMGLYSKCGKLEEVCRLFEKLEHKDVISWNTMLSCYVSMQMYGEALNLFDQMIIDGVEPDEITMVSLVSACAKLRDLDMGQKLHLYVEENGLKVDGSLLNCLVDMYVKCGEMEEACKLSARHHESGVDNILWTTLVCGYAKSNKLDKARNLFDQMTEKNLISWTTMISGYVQGGHYLESLRLFMQMMFEDVSPDEVALVTALSACVHGEDFMFGRAIHGLIVKYGMVIDGFLGNALVDLYAKGNNRLADARLIFEQLPSKTVVTWNSMLDALCRSGDIDETRKFFRNIPEKDIVSWNTMVSFCVKNGMFGESFELFRRMQSSKLKPDKITLISLLSACANAGALNHGIWIHVYIKKNDIELDAILGTALIDMYGKCGRVEIAHELFSTISDKTTSVWTAMIAAYAMEGNAQKAIDIYLEMEETATKPDYVTFIALLSACSHGGLVSEGYKYFNKMRTFYNIHPKTQHYGCMVDLLGRAGHLEEALKFLETMPIEPDVSIWSSVMSACLKYHNVELAEHAFKHLIEKDPINHGAYTLLSNIYAKARRWDDVSKMRMKLHGIGEKKQPGLSLIEQGGVVHEFTAGTFSNPWSTEIRSLLQEMDRIIAKQEFPDGSSQHSERLAVAFSLLTSKHAKVPIRVMNSVRMCQGCHHAMKLISQAYDREIVIRDNYRFHRFKDGHCSCKDYW